MQCKTIGMFFL